MGHIDPTKEIFAQFRDNDRPGPIHMLNLVRLRKEAAYPDGRKASGAEAYAAYGRDSGPVFERLGGRIVWQGKFELMLIGPESRALGPLLHRRISKRRRLRRDDPRSRLSRSGEASAGRGGGFTADPARGAAGGEEFWRDTGVNASGESLSIVMAGLDPAIHALDLPLQERGCPGQARA